MITGKKGNMKGKSSNPTTTTTCGKLRKFSSLKNNVKIKYRNIKKWIIEFQNIIALQGCLGRKFSLFTPLFFSSLLYTTLLYTQFKITPIHLFHLFFLYSIHPTSPPSLFSSLSLLHPLSVIFTILFYPIPCLLKTHIFTSVWISFVWFSNTPLWHPLLLSISSLFPLFFSLFLFDPFPSVLTELDVAR